MTISCLILLTIRNDTACRKNDSSWTQTLELGVIRWKVYLCSISMNVCGYFPKNLKQCVWDICWMSVMSRHSKENTTHDSLLPYLPAAYRKNGSSWKRTLALVVMRWKVYLLQRSMNISSCFRKNLESKTLKTLFCWKWSAQLFIPTRVKNKKLLRIIFLFFKRLTSNETENLVLLLKWIFSPKGRLDQLERRNFSGSRRVSSFEAFRQNHLEFEFYWERWRTFS